MSNARFKGDAVKTDLDDWETDPDFVRDMDEMDQRWGAQRTVGSVNMREILDEVQKNHRLMRERLDHPSQKGPRDYKIKTDRIQPGAGYIEELSKHSSQEYTRKVITSSSTIKGGGVSEAKRVFLEKANEPQFEHRPRPTVASKTSLLKRLGQENSSGPEKVEEAYSKSYSKEERTSSMSSSKGLPDDVAFKSIQKKIDVFKKEFEDLDSKLGKKSDAFRQRDNATAEPSDRSKEFGSLGGSRFEGGAKTRDIPSNNIKSLSERFETMCRDDSEEFKRKTEAKRKEFFTQIKDQVLETRKGLEGFDPLDDDYHAEVEKRIREKLTSRAAQRDDASPAATGPARHSPSPSSHSSSRLSDNSPAQLGRPKFFTRREVTQEEFVSKIVKENDKIVENETKRNVQRSSSCHGSSDEEDKQPSSIKLFRDNHKLRSPTLSPSPDNNTKREARGSPSLEQKQAYHSDAKVQPEKSKGAGLMARTLFDYQAAESDELSFDVDDLITDIQKIDVGWYKGTITKDDGKKQVGLFPANYVKLLNDHSER